MFTVNTPVVMVVDRGTQKFLHAGSRIPDTVDQTDIDRLLKAGLIIDQRSATPHAADADVHVTSETSAKPSRRPRTPRVVDEE